MLIADVSSGQVEIVKPQPTSSEIISVRVDDKISSFIPWQHFSGGKFGLVGARVEISDRGTDSYSSPESARVTLVRANGEHVVTARVEYKGTVTADNFVEGYATHLYMFEMVPTTVATTLVNNESLDGTMFLRKGRYEYVIPLPETQVEVTP